MTTSTPLSSSSQIIGTLPAATGQSSTVPGALNARNRNADTFRPPWPECRISWDPEYGEICDCAVTIPESDAVDTDRICVHCGEVHDGGDAELIDDEARDEPVRVRARFQVIGFLGEILLETDDRDAARACALEAGEGTEFWDNDQPWATWLVRGGELRLHVDEDPGALVVA